MPSTTAGRSLGPARESHVRNGRLDDVPVGSGMGNGSLPRASHGSEVDWPPRNAPSTRTGGIWGNPNSRAAFAAAAPAESSRGKGEHDLLPSVMLNGGHADGNTSVESVFNSPGPSSSEAPTRSGTFMPSSSSSETENWLNRASTPWDRSENIPPASSQAQRQQSTMLSLRSGANSQRPSTHIRRDPPRKDLMFPSTSRQDASGHRSSEFNPSSYAQYVDQPSNPIATNNMDRPRVAQLSGKAKPFRVPYATAESQPYEMPLGLASSGGHAPIGDRTDATMTSKPDPRGVPGLDAGGPLAPFGGAASSAASPYFSLANGVLSQPPVHQVPTASTHRSAQPHPRSFSTQPTMKPDAYSREAHEPELARNSFEVLPEPSGAAQNIYTRAPASVLTSNAGNTSRFPLTALVDHSTMRQTSPPRSRGSWAPTESERSQGIGSFTPEGFPEGAFVDQLGSYRSSRLSVQGSMSPADSDYRRAHQSPYYSTGGTPAPEADHVRAASRGAHASRPFPNGHSILLERKLRGLQQAQQNYMISPSNPMMIGPESYRNHFMSNNYEYNMRNGSGLNPMTSYLPLVGMLPGQMPPRSSSKDHDATLNMRSPLLEEFRSNAKTSKRYELRDIYDHVVEFSGDQYGSRFIQQKLETANSDEKEQVFREIKPNSLQLMTDVFGNYVIQKFFEHGTQQQKTILAEQMKGHILTLSLQMYGCRVVQKALEHVLVDQQASLVKEIEPHVLKCVKDQNGNHVIQKAIERVPLEHTQFINDAFIGQVHTLATHPYGCRVIQRMLEHCGQQAQSAILEELYVCGGALIQDQYGNYVTQHVIEHGKEEERAKVISLVTAQLVHYSKHKFASNVVEKSIQFGTDEHRSDFLDILTTASPGGTSPLQTLMKDQYGNYVIQKLLGQLKADEYDKLVEEIKPQLVSLKKYSHGKQIVAIEKLLATAQTASPSPTSAVADTTTVASSPVPPTDSRPPEGSTPSDPPASTSSNVAQAEDPKPEVVDPPSDKHVSSTT